MVASGMASAASGQQAGGRRVAITLDDGPAMEAMRDLGAFRRIASGLIASLQAEQVPATVFVNERQLDVEGQRDARVAVLRQWLDAGFELGNHTYSHPSANHVPVREFQEDIVRGEAVSKQLLTERGRRLVWFRHPYLHSGATAEAHRAIGDFLEQRGYRVAPVTVDYADYAFADAYRRMLRSGQDETADRIRQAYLDQVDVGFEHAERTSRGVLGREIPQILLIHCSQLNALTLGESVGRMRDRGYRFIGLDEAAEDEAYRRPDTFAGAGGSWLSRAATSMGKKLGPGPQLPQWIRALPR